MSTKAAARPTTVDAPRNNVTFATFGMIWLPAFQASRAICV
jgi:hypothetical protein